MRLNRLNILFVIVLLFGGSVTSVAQERPKLREISDKKLEVALQGVVPWEKKGECGYADAQGKFVIPPIFHKVMPMSDRNVGFVCFLDETGNEYWTPIAIQGLYLTELNFSQVVKDFDERGLAVVRQEDKYGIINHAGKMVAGCSYHHFEDKGLVYLLYNINGGCIAVAKDKTEKGYTAYSFAAKEPIIVETEGGYGIITQKNYFVVADFIYDSIKELISWEVYSLQKGPKKYLYASDKLSMGYDDIIPGQGANYFVVKHNGKYGILTTKNETLLSCCQDEMPVLLKNGYTCLYENGSPVYLTAQKRVSASEYDDYLYFQKYKGAAAEYLLDETLAFENKKNVVASLAACYGTKNFDLVKHLDAATKYAESRRYILLSNDDQNAKYYDLDSKSYVNSGEILYHAFPSKSGVPAFASVLRGGKFGIMDVRNGSLLLEAEYDKISPLCNGYVSLRKADSLYLYHVNDNIKITTRGCEGIDDKLLDWGIIIVKQDGQNKVYNIEEHRWTLPDDHTLVRMVPIPGKDNMLKGYAALMKKTAKGALYDPQSGEKLSEYLFDDVHNEIFADKYIQVTVTGKVGLYDIETKRYVLPCEHSKVGGYNVFNGNEFVVITKAGKQGVYNITDSKMTIAPQNDGVDMRGGYARIRRGGRYAVYSLEYNKMVFESPVEEVELMNDGYALLKSVNGYERGVYNLNWNEWYIDPIEGCDMCFLGGDYIGVANMGVGNYKTNKLILRTEDEWVEAFLEVNGDFVVMSDPVEGASMWLYRLGDPNFNLAASSIEVLTSSNTSMSDKNLAIVEEYQYGEGWEILSVLHCKLQDLDSGRAIIADQAQGVKFNDMEYLDPGLVKVSMENGQVWLFDIYTEHWILKSSGEINTYTIGGNRKDVKDKYLIITFDNVYEYLFDPYDRVLVQLKDNFGVRDYNALKEAKKIVPNSVLSGYDRISLMYEQK